MNKDLNAFTLSIKHDEWPCFYYLFNLLLLFMFLRSFYSYSFLSDLWGSGLEKVIKCFLTQLYKDL